MTKGGGQGAQGHFMFCLSGLIIQHNKLVKGFGEKGSLIQKVDFGHKGNPRLQEELKSLKSQFKEVREEECIGLVQLTCIFRKKIQVLLSG
ncbi:hypothetical protein NQZ68_040200 [Dissostichus eleginoides]|nr:hypothetical protein NQZ68_040200 [Dissostichus eleginoides]